MVHIALLAINGCLSSSISNLIDAFTIANMWHRSFSKTGTPLFELKIIAPSKTPIACSDCILIKPHQTLDEAIQADYLILPALLPIPDSRSLQIPEVLNYIRESHEAGTTIASVCTGTFLLAETGLLNSKIATTNWQFEKKFRYRHPEVNLQIGKILTETDNIICSGATSAIMHLALNIIRREGSLKLASACAKAMLVDPNNNSQAPYTSYALSAKHRDEEVRKAEEYMQEHLSTTTTIDKIAEHVCLSPRHFKRRFKKATGETPLNYLQKLRIQSAKDQLENSLDSIEEITRQVGYEDSSTFRRLFKRHTSLSPREYRDRFLLLEKD